MAHRARGQKETSDLGHSEVRDHCPFRPHLLGSAAGTGQDREVAEGLGRTPPPTLKFRSLTGALLVGGDVPGSFQREGGRETAGAPTAAPPPPHAQGEKVSGVPSQKEFTAPRSQHACIHMA